MGPGLFFALALLFAGAAKAEMAVGLDAKGVDPMAAVDNRMGLDVRDELGRPVSGQAVLSELKSAAVARVAQTAFASALPKAKTVLPALELAVGWSLSLVQLAETIPGPQAWSSLPSPGPKLALLILVVLGAVAARAAVRRPRTMLVSLLPCQRCPEVLRC